MLEGSELSYGSPYVNAIKRFSSPHLKGGTMNVTPLIVELRKERGRLDEAILALERLSAVSGRGGRALQLVRGNSTPAEPETTDYPVQTMAAAR